MRWESWSEFWAMGGYGVYVWGSMGMTAALLAMEVGQARLMRRQVLRQLQLEHTVATWGDE
jgi:heme exporter protein D